MYTDATLAPGVIGHSDHVFVFTSGGLGRHEPALGHFFPIMRMCSDPEIANTDQYLTLLVDGLAESESGMAGARLDVDVWYYYRVRA
jgi:hypothetical protein